MEEKIKKKENNIASIQLKGKQKLVRESTVMYIKCYYVLYTYLYIYFTNGTITLYTY